MAVGVADKESQTAADPQRHVQLPEQHAVHIGVACDGCNMNPICGPRFKSKTRADFDLCESCVQGELHKTDDYSKIDQPNERLQGAATDDELKEQMTQLLRVGRALLKSGEVYGAIEKFNLFCMCGEHMHDSDLRKTVKYHSLAELGTAYRRLGQYQ